jgi:serine/threonine-protein kinase SRPK3
MRKNIQKFLDARVYHPHDSDCAEDVELYRQRGFHPVHIGDEFSDGRYVIVNKLSFGGYSTVWLAKDQRLNRYVVLKIMIADAATGKVGVESRILHLLADAHTESSEPNYLLEILDDFYFDGPNGRHLCVVSEPAIGRGVGAFKDEETNLYSLTTARIIATQVILGLKQIHISGVVHGGT